MVARSAAEMQPIVFNAPEVIQNPYPLYARLRKQPGLVPVSQRINGRNTPLATRYNDVVTILKDPRFGNDMRKLAPDQDFTKLWYIPRVLKIFAYTVAMVDEPDHTRLRGLVHKAFTPRMIQDMSTSIEQIADNLLDKAANKEVIDLVKDYAVPLPLTVIADMLGVGEADRKAFGRYVTNNVTDATSASPLEMLKKVRNSFGLNKLLTGLINDRRMHPKEDLISALVQAEEAGDRLSDEELLAMLFLLLFAGHETTASLLNAGTFALLQHPIQFEQLKANMGGLDVAIEELLRFTSPVQHIAVRYAREDVTYEGTFIPKGGSVLISPASANRDETVFDQPDELIISRDPNRHVAFGFGIHYCLGAPLARIEAKIGFTRLFERFPNMQLAVPAGQLKWRGGPALRGLMSLPIRLKG